MPRHLLQTITVAALLVATIFVAHNFVRYIIRVDGGYSEWSMFSECTLSCGTGTRFRTRTCTNPSPKFGGRNCSSFGEALEQFECNTLPCPVDGGYGAWSDYGECSVTCGGGQQSRERKCNNPEPLFGGKTCEQQELGPGSETKICNDEACPVDGGFGPWLEFGECSVTCGNGEQKRERRCDSPEPQHGGKPCEGPNEETRSCEQGPCPVDGGYTEWSEFSPCSEACGTGTQSRSRKCSNPEPSNGGKNCDHLGPNEEARDCSNGPCADKTSPDNRKESKEDDKGGDKEKEKN